MELGTQQGLRSAAALRDYANFWDTVGDATGESAEELAKTGAALQAVGIAIGEEEKAMNAFSFVTEHTTQSVGEFLNFISKTAPELNRMGLDVDDTAAFLAAMEKELGLAGRTARSEFKEALDQSKGSMDKALKLLGLTTDQVAKYRGQVAQTSGVIERNAKIHEQSFTPIQRLKSAVADFAFAHGDAIKAASQFAPLLIAAGPAAKAATVAISIVSAATNVSSISFTALGVAARTAWRAVLGPIGLVVLAIGGIVTAIVLFRDKWRQILDAIGNWIAGFVNFFINPVINGLNVFAGIFGKKVAEPLEEVSTNFGFVERGAEKANKAVEEVSESLGDVKNALDPEIVDAIEGTIAGVEEIKDSFDDFNELNPLVQKSAAEFYGLDRSVEQVQRRAIAMMKAEAMLREEQDRLTKAVRFAREHGWDSLFEALQEGAITVEEFIIQTELANTAQQLAAELAEAHAEGLRAQEDAATAALEAERKLRQELAKHIGGQGAVRTGIVAPGMSWVEGFGWVPIDESGNVGFKEPDEFGQGGTVGGRVGEPQLILAHGGEEVIPVGGAARSGGVTIENHFHGSVYGVDDLEEVISRTLRNRHRRGGFDGIIE